MILKNMFDVERKLTFNFWNAFQNEIHSRLSKTNNEKWMNIYRSKQTECWAWELITSSDLSSRNSYRPHNVEMKF